MAFHQAASLSSTSLLSAFFIPHSPPFRALTEKHITKKTGLPVRRETALNHFFLLVLVLLPFPCSLHPVNRFAHKHAMADVIIEEPHSQADASEPAVPGEGKRCEIRSTGMDTGTNSACLRGPENGDAEKKQNAKY